MSKRHNGADRRAWMTPYTGGVSQSDEDRNRGVGLPSTLAPSSYGRIAQVLESKREKREALSRQWRGQPPVLASVVEEDARRAASSQRRTASAGPSRGRRFASVEAVEAAGFSRVASCMYKKGHDIWELRGADSGGYELVRKREERAVDLRHAAGGGMAPAVEAGIIRTAAGRTAQGAPHQAPSAAVVVRQAIRLVARYAQLSPEQTQAYEREWQQGRSLSAVLQEVNDILQFRGRVPELVQVKQALEALIAKEQGASGRAARRQHAQVVDDYDGGGLTEPVGGGEPEAEMPVDEGEYLGDTAEQAFDVHEVMHGREPEFDPAAPMVQEMEQVVDEAQGEEYGLGPEMGAPDLEGDLGHEDSIEMEGEPSPAARCARCGEAKHAGACAGRRGRVRARKGLRILAVRRGAVAEGIVLELLPLGDLLADFGTGPEPVAGDMVLEPELDLEDLELDDDEAELEADEADAEDADEDAAGEDEGSEADEDDEDEADDEAADVPSGGEPAVLVITVDDVLGM